MQDMPYFMQDERWYYFKDGKFVLTDDAPKEAHESLEEFYATEKKMGYGG